MTPWCLLQVGSGFPPVEPSPFQTSFLLLSRNQTPSVCKSHTQQQICDGEIHSSEEALPSKVTVCHDSFFTSEQMEIMLYSCNNTYTALENDKHQEVALKKQGSETPLVQKGTSPS